MINHNNNIVSTETNTSQSNDIMHNYYMNIIEILKKTKNISSSNSKSTNENNIILIKKLSHQKLIKI